MPGTEPCHQATGGLRKRRTDRLRLVLQLFFVEELNFTEIAAVLEVSVPRVQQLRAKVLKDLRKLLDAEMAGG
jgi:RNA polymerase sigma factor FliA